MEKIIPKGISSIFASLAAEKPLKIPPRILVPTMITSFIAKRQHSETYSRQKTDEKAERSSRMDNIYSNRQPNSCSHNKKIPALNTAKERMASTSPTPDHSHCIIHLFPESDLMNGK